MQTISLKLEISIPVLSTLPLIFHKMRDKWRAKLSIERNILQYFKSLSVSSPNCQAMGAFMSDIIMDYAAAARPAAMPDAAPTFGIFVMPSLSLAPAALGVLYP